MAELGGVNSVEPHKLFPSEESTKFGDWVKAGALKVGDQISSREGISGGTSPSVAGQDLAFSQIASPRTDGKADALAENKQIGNDLLTITKITQDNIKHRVYNLEVESRDGQNTHNYFVGEEELWVHNGKLANIIGGIRIGLGVILAPFGPPPEVMPDVPTEQCQTNIGKLRNNGQQGSKRPKPFDPINGPPNDLPSGPTPGASSGL